MTTILRLDSGAAHDASITRSLANEVIAQLSDATTTVITRDLSAGAPGAVTHHWVAATSGGVTDTAEQQEALAESDLLVAELLAADVLVITAPIYNFSFPASLKLWIDQIARAGRTFAYSEAGPKGLLEGKRAVIVVASGGVPIGSPVDFATPYLRHVLGFIGITDVQVVAAERTAFDIDESLKSARGQIAALAS